MQKFTLRGLSFLLAIAVAFAVASDMRLTVEQLTAFIRSAVSMKQPDRQVAEYLKHVKMVNKLDDRAIEDLQTMGAGPKTVAALRALGDASVNLPAPPPAPVQPVAAAPIPGPNSIEQAGLIDEIRKYALNYIKQLPDFICVQVTRRYYDPSSSDSWRPHDTITTRVSYNEHKEDYKVILVNSRPVTTDTPMQKLGGTTTAGEFGSMLDDIFLPSSAAQFGWDHWATLRGKRVYVFSYDIDQAHSKYHISVEGAQDYVPAYRGLIYADTETKAILRITLAPEGLPVGYPVQQIKSVLDYDYQKIGSSEYLLPLKVVVTSRLARYSSKNEVEFRLYRKFGTETTIKFDTPEPLPEEKTKETPPKP